MPNAAQRTWVIEEGRDAETGELSGHYDRDQALACMEEIEHLLFMVGGMCSFAADRVQVGELGREPLAVSRRLIVTWSAYSPLRKEGRIEPVTQWAPIPEPSPDPTPEELEDQLADDAEAEEDEEPERDLTTTGPPRPDAEM